VRSRTTWRYVEPRWRASSCTCAGRSHVAQVSRRCRKFARGARFVEFDIAASAQGYCAAP
jgi:hypothetical protein